MDWTAEDVSNWLEGTLSLPQYADVFASNEMHGAVLLDLSLADLDYMNVSVLAHRKKILKAVEELRLRAASSGESSSSSGRAAAAKAAGSVHSMKDLPKAPVGAEAVNAPAPGQHTVHWSHLQPLSSNDAPNEPMLPNAADSGEGVRAYSKGGADDVLDEAAEQAAFKEAVMAWRNSGKTVTASGTTTNNGTASSSNGSSSATAGSKLSLLAGSGAAASSGSNTGGVGGGWSDPFAARPQITDDDDDDDILGERREQQDREQAKAAVAGSDSGRSPLSGVKTVGGMTITYQPMTEEEEAKEREEFKKAVMEWRRDTGRGVVEPAAGAAAAGVGTSGTGTGTADMGSSNNNSVDTITERLARQLDTQYEANARKLEEQKLAARQQMEKAARDLEAARNVRVTQNSAQGSAIAVTDSTEDEDDDYVTVGASPGNAGALSSPQSHPDGEGEDSAAAAVRTSNGKGTVKEHPAGRYKLPLNNMRSASPPRTTPRIDLVESTITYTARGEGKDESKQVAEEEMQYLVEEASDDEA